MTAPASAEVRSHTSRVKKSAVRRWRVWGFPLTLLAIGSLAGLALVTLTTAMGGLG